MPHRALILLGVFNRETIPTLGSPGFADFAKLEENVPQIMPMVSYSTDAELNLALAKLFDRVIPEENQQTKCDYEVMAARVCADQGDYGCAQGNIDRALAQCTDLSAWSVSMLSAANRSYPGRYEAELAEAIAGYEPALHKVHNIHIAYEYQSLLERDDFRQVLVGRVAHLADMYSRYRSAVESDDLESMRAER